MKYSGGPNQLIYEPSESSSDKRLFFLQFKMKRFSDVTILLVVAITRPVPGSTKLSM